MVPELCKKCSMLLLDYNHAVRYYNAIESIGCPMYTPIEAEKTDDKKKKYKRI